MLPRSGNRKFKQFLQVSVGRDSVILWQVCSSFTLQHCSAFLKNATVLSKDSRLCSHKDKVKEERTAIKMFILFPLEHFFSFSKDFDPASRIKAWAFFFLYNSHYGCLSKSNPDKGLRCVGDFMSPKVQHSPCSKSYSSRHQTCSESHIAEPHCRLMAQFETRQVPAAKKVQDRF